MASNYDDVKDFDPNEEWQCCLCNDWYTGWGNNPAPFKGERCCNMCNSMLVIPARIADVFDHARGKR